MLPSIETIFENVDEEIPLVFIKTFQIQSCVHMFHLFQDTRQPKLGGILNATDIDDPTSLVHDRYAIAYKNKN